MSAHERRNLLAMVSTAWPDIIWSTQFVTERDVFSICGEHDGRTETRSVRLTLANSLSDRALINDLSQACQEIAETLQPPQPTFIDFESIGA